jgi:hypothetical protein
LLFLLESSFKHADSFIQQSLANRAFFNSLLRALPLPKVLEEIVPPFTIFKIPAPLVTVTMTFPALPLLPSAEMPVKPGCMPNPSIVSIFAVTVTLPPLPTLNASELTNPPFASVTMPARLVTVTVTFPAFPLEFASEKIPEAPEEEMAFSPEIDNTLTVTFRSAPRPAESLSPSISPPSVKAMFSAFTVNAPASPLPLCAFERTELSRLP